MAQYSKIRSRKPVFLGLFALAALAAACLTPVSVPSAHAAAPGTITKYTDVGQAPSWGKRSYWMQPWRSYLSTVPATTLLDAIGINFNVGARVSPMTARLLAENGFNRARMEIGWNSMSYDDPGSIDSAKRADLEEKVKSLRDNGIRPLILLNGNHGEPCPTKAVSLTLAVRAPVGATQVQLDPTSIEPGEIVPRRTGITANGIAAAHMFTSVSPTGLAQLSKPLTSAIAAGNLPAVTLRFEPFSSPIFKDGSTNPRSRQTRDGWLAYAQAVTRFVKSTLGSEEFDVEIWNELSFGSNFLNINTYYEPDTETKPLPREIVEETVDLLRDPTHGFPNIGIGNGFASQTPHGIGIRGTAIDKHPYFNMRAFPASKDLQLTRPVDGQGQLDGIKDSSGGWHDTFTPTFTSYFPEYSLTSIQTETLIYDLAPYESQVGGDKHGRTVQAVDGSAPSPVWVTEVNLAPGPTQKIDAKIYPVDVRHMESKIILRYISSFVNKGVTAIDFYAASGGDLSLVDRQFFDSIKPRSAAYPGVDAGGETTSAVRRFTQQFTGAEPIASPRHLSLQSLTDFEGNVQFEGDGSASHPPLFNRDVLAFLPFQVNAHRFVIPTYVMTRDVAHVYDSDVPEADPRRFDMPEEPYELTIGGVRGVGADVTAMDPVTGQSTAVQVVSGTSSDLTVKMEVTDSPRLLTIQEHGDPDPGQEPPDEEVPPDEPGEEEPVDEVPPDTSPGDGGELPPDESGDLDDGDPAPKGKTRSAAPTATPDRSKLRLHLQLGNSRTLLGQRRVLALAGCSDSCSVEFSGRLKLGRRQAPMRVGDKRPGVTSPESTGAAYLTVSGSTLRSIRTALARGDKVQATIVASASGADGETADVSRTLTITRSPKG